MSYDDLISERNLSLAWSRILTSTGMQYKQMFRPIYYAFQAGAAENIRRLRERLQGGWQPTAPDRIYLPKPSGLQRPITVLDLNDQIVLQAIANRFATSLRDRRARVENRLVYSNVLSTPPDSIFFVRDWRRTYRGFQQRCVNYYQAGEHWVAHFDIAAFYDTISHELLLRRVAPRGGDAETWTKVRAWLKRWSRGGRAPGYQHGIPQGPIASDFLAEAFLLPVDEALQQAGVSYVRYVDDIRLFARTENEVRAAALLLEKECRKIGLVPQGQKFAVHRARSVFDILGALPSLPPDDRDTGAWEYDDDETIQMFRSSLEGRPLRVTDKSGFRFVLYRAPALRKILTWCCSLLPRHPEHIDAFCAYFERFESSVPLVRAIEEYLNSGVPYEYVRGRLWAQLRRLADETTIRRLAPVATAELKLATGLMHRSGVFEFLIAAEKIGLRKVVGRVRHESPLVQAWLVPSLPDRAWHPTGVVRHLLVNGNPLPAIQCVDGLVQRGLSHASFGLRVRDLSPEAQNSFRAVGIIFRRNAPRVDQIADLLSQRFGVQTHIEWRVVLGGEYSHALSLLLRADSLFSEGPSNWLMHQNGFNETLFRSFVRFLHARGMIPGVLFVNPTNGRTNTYGWLVGPGQDFDAAYPRIASALYSANHRRNRLPNAHAYGNRGVRNQYLGRRERDQLSRDLAIAFEEISAEVLRVR